MTEAFLTELRALEFDSLTAKEAVELRALLNDAVAKSDGWFAGLARDFAKPANPANGRPPENQTSVAIPPDVPVKPPTKPPTPAKRRGRPVPDVKIKLNKRPAPAPIAVGGADAGEGAPQPAQIFQDSYVSKDGPRPGAALPPDHPRRAQMRESSVTPEVDMSDFAQVEEAVRKGQLNKVFQ